MDYDQGLVDDVLNGYWNGLWFSSYQDYLMTLNSREQSVVRVSLGEVHFKYWVEWQNL